MKIEREVKLKNSKSCADCPFRCEFTYQFDKHDSGSYTTSNKCVFGYSIELYCERPQKCIEENGE